MNDLTSSYSEPPTTIAATLNPMMGHLSTAYAARMTRDIVACSRFDFNVYSYDSDLTLGAEYWLHSNAASPASPIDDAPKKHVLPDPSPKVVAPVTPLSVDRQLQARVNAALSLREGMNLTSPLLKKEQKMWSLRDAELASNSMVDDVPAVEAGDATPIQDASTSILRSTGPIASTLGVIKARISTSGNVALLWEGRLRNCLVSFGIKADLSSNQSMGSLSARKPLRGVGLDVIYFTQNRQEGASSRET